MHCTLLHTQTAKQHGCNDFVHCCMPRPQSIVLHIASMANKRMSMSHSRYVQCYLMLYIYIYMYIYIYIYIHRLPKFTSCHNAIMVVTGRAHCSILLYITLQIHSVEHSNGLGGESLRETFTICIMHRSLLAV